MTLFIFSWVVASFVATVVTTLFGLQGIYGFSYLSVVGLVMVAAAQSLVLRGYVDWAFKWAMAAVAQGILYQLILRFLGSGPFRHGDAVGATFNGIALAIASAPVWFVLNKNVPQQSWLWILARPLYAIARLASVRLLLPVSAYINMASPLFAIRYSGVAIPAVVVDAAVLAWLLRDSLQAMSNSARAARVAMPISPEDQARGLVALRVARICLALTIVAIALVFFAGPVFSAYERASQDALLATAAFALPFALALAMTFAQGTLRHVGLVLAAGCAVVSLVLVSPLALLSFAFIGFASQWQVASVLVMFGALVLQVGVIVAVRRARAAVLSSEHLAHPWPFAVFTPIVYVMTLYGGYQVLEARRSESFRQVSEHTRRVEEGFERLHKCVVQYAESNPKDGFPTLLSFVGPQGAGCAPADLASGEFEGYRFLYASGLPDETGRVRLYTLCARPIAFRTNGMSTYVTDDSNAQVSNYGFGVDQKDSFACVKMWGESGSITAVKHCALTYAAAHPATGYPSSMQDMSECVAEAGRSLRLSSPDTMSGGGRLTYIAGSKDASGRISSYEIYEASGTGYRDWRGLYTDATGVVHVAQNRLAIASDPTQEELNAANRHRNEERNLRHDALAGDCADGDQRKCYLLAELTMTRARRVVTQQVKRSDDITAQPATMPEALQRDLDDVERIDTLACRMGVGDACLVLGRMYFDPDLGRFDLDRAIEFYWSACDLGDISACFTMADKLQTGSPTTPGYVSRQQWAAKLHARACDLGGAQSCLALARMLTDGYIAPKDEARVPALVERSCALGWPEGCYRMTTDQRAGRLPEELHRLVLKACAAGDKFPSCPSPR